MDGEAPQTTASDKPWEDLALALAGADFERVKSILKGLDSSETALVISRLTDSEQSSLMTILEPAHAAEVMVDVPQTQAAEIMVDLPTEQAAAIVEEMQSDVQVDLLAEMPRKAAAAILEELPPVDAQEARVMLKYPQDSAGGLMVTEYLSFNTEATIRDVRQDLNDNLEKYSTYLVRYVYVTGRAGRLRGVLRMDNLLFSPMDSPLEQVMLSKPLFVRASDRVDELKEFFREHPLFGVPVVDDDGVLRGVLMPDAVDRAVEKKAVKQFLWLSGIIGGEEFRTMPISRRSGRRLSWLTINILLNILAASVIAYYQDTLQAVIALAVFLPMISDMSGCSGNQAVAVSMRELTLGLVRPAEIGRVFIKEFGLGMLNGFALGAILGTLAYVWKGNIWLGIVVGGALMANTVVAVCVGGLLPLVLKKLRLDPALVASPVLTTVTDMCGFFLVLGMASHLISRLA